MPLLSLAFNQYLSQPQLVSIAREKTKTVDALERKLWLARRNLMRQSARSRSLKEELEQLALRGDVRGLVASLNSIIKNGQEKAKPAFIPFLCDLARSASLRDADGHDSRAMRWRETSKKIFAFMQVKGKGGLIRMLRATADAPSDERIQAQWARDMVRLIMGEHLENFTSINGIYVGLMKLLGIIGPVPYELQEDESHIGGRVDYDQHRDIPVGTCGAISDTHQCDANHTELHIHRNEGVDACDCRVGSIILFDSLTKSFKVFSWNLGITSTTPIIHLLHRCQDLVSRWSIIHLVLDRSLSHEIDRCLIEVAILG